MLRIFIFACILVICYCNSLLSLPVEVGYQVLDLYGSKQESLESLMSSWIYSNSSATKPEIFTCQGELFLGGFINSTDSAQLEKKYRSLPQHDTVYYYIRFAVIDESEIGMILKNSLSILSVAIDGVLSFSSVQTVSSTKGNQNLCGDPSKIDDTHFVVVGKTLHSAKTLKLFIGLRTIGARDKIKSLWIREVRMMFGTTREGFTQKSYAKVRQIATSAPNYSPCTFKQYSNNGQCLACHSNCKECFGASESECYACEEGYFYDGAVCKSCPSGCMLCSNQNQCQQCFSGSTLFWDGSCRKEYCNPRYDFIKIGEFERCDQKLSEKTEAKARTIANIKNVLESIIASVTSLLSIINFSNPAAILLTSFSGMLNDIKYIEAGYPPLLQYSLDVDASNVFNIIPSAPETIVSELPKQRLPDKFEQYMYHSSFIINFWKSGLTLLVLCSIVALSCVLEILTRKSRKFFHNIFKRIKHTLKWNLALLFFTSYFGEIVLFGSFEFRTAHPNSGWSIVSLIICILTNIIALAVLVKMIMVIKALRKEKSDNSESYQDKERFIAYEVLFVDYEDQSFIQQAFMCVSVIRVYLFKIVISYLFDYPLAQSAILFLMTMSMLLYLVKERPLLRKLELAQYITQELVITAVNLCVVIFAILNTFDIRKPELKDNITDLVIITNISFNMVGAIFLLLKFLDKVKCLNKKEVPPKQSAGVNQSSIQDQSTVELLRGRPITKDFFDEKNLNTSFENNHNSASLKMGPGQIQVKKPIRDLDLKNNSKNTDQTNLEEYSETLKTVGITKDEIKKIPPKQNANVDQSSIQIQHQSTIELLKARPFAKDSFDNKNINTSFEDNQSSASLLMGPGRIQFNKPIRDLDLKNNSKNIDESNLEEYSETVKAVGIPKDEIKQIPTKQSANVDQSSVHIQDQSAVVILKARAFSKDFLVKKTVGVSTKTSQNSVSLIKKSAKIQARSRLGIRTLKMLKNIDESDDKEHSEL